MVASVKELHKCELGEREYWFRSPTVYDLPRIRRELARQGIRRPQPIEFRVTALAGLSALGESAGEPEETERQKALMEDWYRLLEPIGEDDIDEPDFEKRAAELERILAERTEQRAAIYGQVVAIEANLTRHWPPYRDLMADRGYWDDISAIEIVRVLLQRCGTEALPRDGEDLLTHAAYRGIPRDDRGPLATYATGLLAPAEAERKN